MSVLLAVLLLGAVSARADDEQDAKGLPVPRFVSLKAAEVNMRVGPGTRYSINWVQWLGFLVYLVKRDGNRHNHRGQHQ